MFPSFGNNQPLSNNNMNPTQPLLPSFNGSAAFSAGGSSGVMAMMGNSGSGGGMMGNGATGVADDLGANLLLQKMGLTIDNKLMSYFQGLYSEATKEHEQLKQQQLDQLKKDQQEEQGLSWFGLGSSTSATTTTKDDETKTAAESVDVLFRKKLDQIKSLSQNEMEELAIQIIGVDNKRVFMSSIEGLIGYYARSASRVLFNNRPNQTTPQTLVVKVPSNTKFIHKVLTYLAQRIRENIALIQDNQITAMSNEILQALYNTILQFTQIEDIVNLPSSSSFEKRQERDRYHPVNLPPSQQFASQTTTTPQASTVDQNGLSTTSLTQPSGGNNGDDLTGMFQSNMAIRDSHLFPAGGSTVLAATQLPSTNSANFGNANIPMNRNQNDSSIFRHSYANVTTTRRMEDFDRLTDDEDDHKQHHHHRQSGKKKHSGDDDNNKKSTLDRLRNPSLRNGSPDEEPVRSNSPARLRRRGDVDAHNGDGDDDDTDDDYSGSDGDDDTDDDYSGSDSDDDDSGTDTDDSGYSDSENNDKFARQHNSHHNRRGPPPPPPPPVMSSSSSSRHRHHKQHHRHHRH